MSPEAFAREMAGIGEALPRTITDIMLHAAQRIQDDIKSNAPRKTGKLIDSIKLIVTGQYLGIEMEDYGWFQNYGVEGTENKSTVFAVPKELEGLKPSAGNTEYKFNPVIPRIGGDLPFGVRTAIHRDGLQGQRFVNIEKIVNKIAEIINKELEL